MDCACFQIFLKNRLKYALTSREVTQIVAQRLIKVDGKVRTDTTYPCGFMDVISIEKSGENFRLLYDVKGRFTIHRITAEEAQYKLAKVKRVQLGPRGVPYLVTHDGRTIRYPDPAIKANDTVRLSLPTKLTDSETPKATGVAPHGVAPSPKVSLVDVTLIIMKISSHTLCYTDRELHPLRARKLGHVHRWS